MEAGLPPSPLPVWSLRLFGSRTDAPGWWLWLFTSACATDPDPKETGGASSVSAAEATEWCEANCLELRPFVEAEGFGADMADDDPGSAPLAPETCEDGYEPLAVHLAADAVVHDCYCLVPDAQRDLDLMPTEVCGWVLKEAYGGSEAALQADCTCDS